MKKLIVTALLVFSIYSNNASADFGEGIAAANATICGFTIMSVSIGASVTGTYYLITNYLPLDDGNLKGGIFAISMILNGILGGYLGSYPATAICLD